MEGLTEVNQLLVPVNRSLSLRKKVVKKSSPFISSYLASPETEKKKTTCRSTGIYPNSKGTKYDSASTLKAFPSKHTRLFYLNSGVWYKVKDKIMVRWGIRN